MNNPFTADGQNPFQTPYQTAGAQPNSGIGIKPFTAGDLGPKGGDAHNGAAKSTAPQSPFLPIKPSSTVVDREVPTSQPQSAPSPNFPPSSAPETASQAVHSNNLSNMAPAVGSPVDFSPEHPARKSQFVVLSAMNSTYPRKFFMTTTSKVDGFTIEEYLGMVSVEIVLPKDLLFRNPAPHGELNRLKSAEDQLQQVKITALDELSGRARLLGAEAVVGVSLQFSQFDAIVCLCSVVGTAVRLKA